MDDQIVYVIRQTGWSLQEVLQLDLLTFLAMVQTLTRLEYRDRADRLWADFYAVNAGMNGKTKLIEDITTRWTTGVGDQPAEVKPTANGVGAFVKMMTGRSL